MVLVTGASSGIGLACADLLARRGFRVYGASRTATEPERAFPSLRMDVDDDVSVAEGVARVLEREGRIDAAVNCAGFGIAGAKRQFETNFFGVLRVCRAVLPAMRERRAGTIVNVSSIAGLVPLPFQGFYSASKFALEGMSEALRMEVRPFGIRVVLVEPGDCRTHFTANRRPAAGADCSGSAYRPWFSAAMKRVRPAAGGARGGARGPLQCPGAPLLGGPRLRAAGPPAPGPSPVPRVRGPDAPALPAALAAPRTAARPGGRVHLHAPHAAPPSPAPPRIEGERRSRTGRGTPAQAAAGPGRWCAGHRRVGPGFG